MLDHEREGDVARVGAHDKDKPLSVSQWLVTIVIFFVPTLGILFYIYWAFRPTAHPARRGFCRAVLILLLVASAIGITNWALTPGVLR